MCIQPYEIQRNVQRLSEKKHEVKNFNKTQEVQAIKAIETEM